MNQIPFAILMPQYSGYKEITYRISGKHAAPPNFDREKLENNSHIFVRYYERSRIITFSEPLGPTDGRTALRHHGDVAGSPILDLPFETCLFDAIAQPIALFKGLFGDTRDNAVFAVLVNEVEPGKYDYFSLEREITPQGLEPFRVVHIPHFWAKDIIIEYHFLVRALMDRLKADDQSIGTIKKKERVRIGVGSERRLHTIREVVFVTPKKLRDQRARDLNVIVDWSHRWEVRGHWRKISGIGKNRNGHYGVNGLTWVTPHTKGPEDKPVVRKQRVVQ